MSLQDDLRAAQRTAETLQAVLTRYPDAKRKDGDIKVDRVRATWKTRGPVLPCDNGEDE